MFSRSFVFLLCASFVSASHYDTLGVSRGATASEIRKAYKKKSLLHHPDKNVGIANHTVDEVKKVNAAYEVLGDPQKRAAYDTGFSGESGFSGRTSQAEESFEESFTKETAQAAFYWVSESASEAVKELNVRYNFPNEDDITKAFELLKRAETGYAAALKLPKSSDGNSEELKQFAYDDIQQAESIIKACRSISNAMLAREKAVMSDPDTIRSAEIAVGEAIDAAANIMQGKPSFGWLANPTGSDVDSVIKSMHSHADFLAWSLFRFKFEHGTASSDIEVPRLHMADLNSYNRYELAKLDYAVVSDLSRSIETDFESGDLVKAGEKVQIAADHFKAARSCIDSIKPGYRWTRKILEEDEVESKLLLWILDAKLQVKKDIKASIDIKNGLMSQVEQMESGSLVLSSVEIKALKKMAGSGSLYSADSIAKQLPEQGNFEFDSWQKNKLSKFAAALLKEIKPVKEEMSQFENRLWTLLFNAQDREALAKQKS